MSYTYFPHISNVQASVFGWFKYTCLDSNSYSVTTLNDCPVYVQSMGQVGDNPTFEEQEQSQQNILVYPNPTTAVVNIEGIKTISKGIITTTNGTVVFETELDENKSSIDLTNWPVGVYILRLESDGEVFNYKLVRQ